MKYTIAVVRGEAGDRGYVAIDCGIDVQLALRTAADLMDSSESSYGKVSISAYRKPKPDDSFELTFADVVDFFGSGNNWDFPGIEAAGKKLDDILKEGKRRVRRKR